MTMINSGKLTLKKKNIRKSRLIVLNKDKILVLKRTKDGLRYSLAGGVVEKKETLKEGLIREVQEEIFAAVQKQELKLLFGYVKKKKGIKIKKRYYVLKTKERYPFQLQETDKFEDLVWVNIIEALQYFKKNERALLEKYLLKLN